MSLRAILWALQDAPVDDPTQALILCAMAETAHDDGTEARASQATYARYARCSRRTLQRHLKAMEESGVIIRGNQALVAHLRPDKRPVVWNLNMSRATRQIDAPDNLTPRRVAERGVTGDASMPERGVNHDTSGASLVTHKPTTEPSLKEEPSTLFIADRQTSVSSPPVMEGFDRFWEQYPRKIGKVAAEAAWKKAIKRNANREHIIGFITQQADAWKRNGKDPQYIPHASTWLNGSRYLEDIDTTGSTQTAGHQTYRNPTDFDVYDEAF